MSGNRRSSEQAASAALCVYSQTQTVAEITAVMGMDPSRSINKGQPVSKRNPEGRKSEEFRWILDSALPETAPLDQHINALLEIVEKKARVLVDKEVEIRCTFSSENGQGGFEFKADLSRRLASNRIDLVVSLYSLGGAT